MRATDTQFNLATDDYRAGQEKAESAVSVTGWLGVPCSDYPSSQIGRTSMLPWIAPGMRAAQSIASSRSLQSNR